jgi:beta-galactosidase
MPAITHDGRSFMIDGRRMWLVSGRIPYARVPRSQWADRILLAKHAGINTIETPVFWNRHETRPGRFDFTGENDLRHFVDLIGKAGLHCILSIGPSIGSEWDFGGLPAYLREKADGPRLRTNDPHFLESCSRYINAVAEQVRGWQITAPGTGGPIILLSVESEWTCGHEQLANSYLGELTRYVREAGLNVPLVARSMAGQEAKTSSRRCASLLRCGRISLAWLLTLKQAKQACGGMSFPA